MRAITGVIAGFLLAAATGPVLAQAEMYAPAPPPPYGYPYNPDGDSGLPYTAGLRGSLAFAGNLNTTVPSPTATSAAASTKIGGGASVYVGARLGWGLRLEGEALYRTNQLEGFSLGGTATPARGYASTGAAMVNLMWDWPVTDFPLRPFFGAGIGGAYTDVSIHDPLNTSSYLKKSGWNFAYSLMGGAEVPLNESSRLTAMYRWMRIDDAGFKCGIGGAPGYRCTSDLTNQSIDLGLEMDM